VNPPPTTDTQPYLIALLGGVSLWLLTSLISGRAEAWDAPMYWTVTYPLAILLAGVLGYRAPRRAWRWAASFGHSLRVTPPAASAILPANKVATPETRHALSPLGLGQPGCHALVQRLQDTRPGWP